jgi:hypothetical protein
MEIVAGLFGDLIPLLLIGTGRSRHASPTGMLGTRLTFSIWQVG